MNCIFCKIASGEIPSKKIHETDEVLAFDDINPQAPVHVLVIPKMHISDLHELGPDNSKAISDIFLELKKIAAIKGIDKSGYRIIINNGRDGGQEVAHLHVHMLGGKPIGRMVSA